MQKRTPFPGQPFAARIADEQKARPIKIRQRLLSQISKQLNVTAVSFFTSFIYPVGIEDADADMIEDVLQHTKINNQLCLVINSPGGDALAAERIVHICQTYSTDGFLVIVPRRAKSAATMIALGSNKVFMCETSELGPIDTQVIHLDENGSRHQFSAYSIVKAYDDLMKKAESTSGKADPYLLQLQRFDAAEIEELRKAVELAKDIAVDWLQKGMMAGQTKKDIERKLEIFLNPEKTKSHGRAIFFARAKETGLNVELIRTENALASTISELYERTDLAVSTEFCKIVESAQYNFALNAPAMARSQGLVAAPEEPGAAD